MVVLRIAAVSTAAFSSAYSSARETLTVEFEALGSLACTFSCNSRTAAAARGWFCAWFWWILSQWCGKQPFLADLRAGYWIIILNSCLLWTRVMRVFTGLGIFILVRECFNEGLVFDWGRSNHRKRLGLESNLWMLAKCTAVIELSWACFRPHCAYQCFGDCPSLL